MEQITRIGMDTSKNVFQLHGAGAADGPIQRKKLTRRKMAEFSKSCRRPSSLLRRAAARTTGRDFSVHSATR